MTDKKQPSKNAEITDELKKAYRAALSGPNGAVIRKDLEFTANMTCHVPGDSHSSAFNEGKRVMARNFLLLGELSDVQI